MPLLAWLARVFLVRRLLGRGRGHGPFGSGATRGLSPRGRRSRRRQRRGFGLFGPVPTYTRRTRRGGRVSAGGCCLPIPLALTVATAGALKLLTGRR